MCSVTSCHRIIPRVKSGLGKTCKGRKNPRGLIDQFTNTVQYSTVITVNIQHQHYVISTGRKNLFVYSLGI